jgi:hypothetical protein
MKKLFSAVIFTFTVSFVFANELFYIERGDTIFLKPDKASRSGDGGEWLVNQYGYRVKIDEGIIVELKPNSPARDVFSKYDIKYFEELSRNIYLVIPSDPSGQFELSRTLLLDGSVENSHPNLIRERRAR